MKILSDELPCELCPFSVEIVLDKSEVMEIYRVMAGLEPGDRVVLENGMTFSMIKEEKS